MFNFFLFFFFYASDVDERILHECLKFMEGLLDKSAGKKAMESFFTDDSDNGIFLLLWNIFLYVVSLFSFYLILYVL